MIFQQQDVDVDLYSFFLNHEDFLICLKSGRTFALMRDSDGVDTPGRDSARKLTLLAWRACEAATLGRTTELFHLRQEINETVRHIYGLR